MNEHMRIITFLIKPRRSSMKDKEIERAVLRENKQTNKHTHAHM